MDSGDSSRAAPTKQERKVCWDSRDGYWQCMDETGDDTKCKALRDVYEQTCPAQWVKHFDRKYVYNQYKKKIETEGYEPVVSEKVADSRQSRFSPEATNNSRVQPQQQKPVQSA